jgi:hypothetical protein
VGNEHSGSCLGEMWGWVYSLRADGEEKFRMNTLNL